MAARASQTWLFLGTELGEKQYAIDEIRKKSAKGTESEETVFYAGETSASTMVSRMQNGSLFADIRLFIIKCAEEIKKKDEVDLLASFIASAPEDTFLILLSEEKNIARGIEKEIPQANVRIFWELSEGRKTDWVKNFFRQEGFRISQEGIQTILELVENNTAALKQECSRLILFLDKLKEINGEEAEKWLSHTREESVFTLFSRIASGDLSRSLESGRMLLAAKTAPQAIFAALASCFRKLIAYLSLKKAGITDELEYKKIGISAPGAKRDYSAAGKRYNPESAEKCLALTAEYDFFLRSAGTYPDQILLDEYIYKIHSLAY